LASICVFVTSSDDKGDTGFNSLLDGQVQSTVLGTTERHGGDGGNALGDEVTSEPLNSSNNFFVGSRATRVQDTDGDELDRAGNTVGLSSDGTRAVSSVSAKEGEKPRGEKQKVQLQTREYVAYPLPSLLAGS